MLSAQRLLTKQIAEVRSAEEVLTILDRELEMVIFNEFHISTAFSRLARHAATFNQSMQDSEVIRSLVRKTSTVVEVGTNVVGRQTASLFWSIGSLGERGRCMQALLSPLADSLLIQALELNAQDLSNVFWSCATMQLTVVNLKQLKPLMVRLCCGALSKVVEFKPLEVSNVFWAMATLRGRAPELLELEEFFAAAAVEKCQNLSSM